MADEHDHGDPSHAHHDVAEVAFGVLTISSSRSRETDASGDALVRAIEDADHVVANRDLVDDDREAIAATVRALVESDAIDAVVTTGGTGLSPDDVTVEAVRPLFDREVPGFGEVFRVRSYEDVGPRAMLSRACAGVSDGVPVFCLPGSQHAATFGTEELILPTVGHVLGLTRGH